MTLRAPHFQGNERITRAALNAPPMRKGETGRAVRLLQQALLDLNYPLPKSTAKYIAPDGRKLADGIYGSEVKKQVRQLQIDEGLGRDGAAGEETFGRLDSMLRTRGIAFSPLPPLPPGSPGDVTNESADSEQLVLETLADSSLNRINFILNAWTSNRAQRISQSTGLTLASEIHIKGFHYVDVGNAVFRGDIDFKTDPGLAETMVYRNATHPSGPGLVARRALNPDSEDRAIIVHEATHAMLDVMRVGVIDALFTEALAFVAECLFFRITQGRARTAPAGRAAEAGVMSAADAIALKILGGQRRIASNDPDFVALETPLTTTHASSANRFNLFRGF